MLTPPLDMRDLRLVGKHDSSPVHGYKSHASEFSRSLQSIASTQYFKVHPRFFVGNFGLDYAPISGGRDQRSYLHVHIAPAMSKHLVIDPRYRWRGETK